MKRSRICILFMLFAAVCVLAAACAARDGTQEAVSASTVTASPGDAISRTDAPSGALTAVSYSDGVICALADGSRYYTPGADHAVTDGGRTVIYYNDLLVAFTAEDMTPEEAETLARSVGGEVVGAVSGGIHAVQIMVEDNTLTGLETLAAQLMSQPQVVYACAEYPVQIMSADDNPWNMDGYEPSRGNEASPDGIDWWAEAVGAYTAWQYADRCGEVRVGIVDNGFYAQHEDLSGQITFVTGEECSTPALHGTLVAGIIGAKNNDKGIRGIADTALLYCADVWPTEDEINSYHTLTEYLAVINCMAQNDVRVVNNSWGCLVPSEKTYTEQTGSSDGYAQWLEQRMDCDLVPTAEACIVMLGQLIDSGYENMIMVHAAGNGVDNGGGSVDARFCGFFSRVTEDVYNSLNSSALDWLTGAGVTYEDIDQRIFVVGSVRNERDAAGNYYIAYFSNWGDTVDICAPGEGVYSTSKPVFDIAYGTYSGTSLAAPMVTGSVAFLWSLEPELTVGELRQLLLDSAQVRAIGSEYSAGWSYPMLNIGAAAEALAAELSESQ